jgi:hypothetical protein
MPLSATEYEDAYAEALLCLADDGHAVGVPQGTSNGTRYCYVDDQKLSDQGVLELWWGEEIPEEIFEGRNCG